MAKRPRDPNKLAKLIVDIATGSASDPVSEAKKHPDRVRGRAGGKRGGKARAKKLSPTERKVIAQKAAAARWHR